MRSAVAVLLAVLFNAVHSADDTRLFSVIEDVFQVTVHNTGCLHPLINQSDVLLKLVDASSKLPSGVMMGHIVDLGDYDECLGIRTKDLSGNEVKGQYCRLMLPLLPPNTTMQPKLKEVEKRGALSVVPSDPTLTFVVCVPNSCSQDYVSNLVNNTTSGLVSVIDCQVKEDLEWTPGEYAVLTFFFLILFLMVSHTLYDYYLQKNDLKPANKLFIVFSVLTNGKALFSTSSRAGQLHCLHGIRFLSIMWVVYGHVYYTGFSAPQTNTVYIRNWIEKLSSMDIVGGTVSVDTFLVLSGLLLAYAFLKIKQNEGKVNILVMYIHRYMRLTPPLFAAILVHLSIMRHFGDGPLWSDMTEALMHPCQQYWWSTLLYLQNYVNPSEMCINQTWYLSVDMQLFILSPLILFPLVRYEKPTFIALVGLVLAGIVGTFTYAWIKEMPGLIVLAVMKTKTEFAKLFYINTIIRFGPWLIGILMGYLIFNKKRNNRLNKVFQNVYLNLLGWIVSLAVLALVLFGPNTMYHHPYKQFESSAFIALHRNAWAIAVSWIIYACVTGHGGPINTFLSLPIFQVLARLTYSIYIIHLSLLYLEIGRTRINYHFSNLEGFYKFWGDLMIPLLLSIFWVLAFESPAIAIEKIFFKSRNTQQNDLPKA